MRRAGEHRLPVKLHCGLLAGHAHMSLERMRNNAADICPTLLDFPETSVVLMHMGWPYQDEYIALAKHFPNAYVDLCWAWIVNPAAAIRFTREFLTAAPASKLLGFGGDYSTAECIAGHAHIARRGLGQALSELVEGGWIPLEHALSILDMVMGGNARRLFHLDEHNPQSVPGSQA
jgi:predicted TIM-barrel fold metal-dependent hydrolase